MDAIRTLLLSRAHIVVLDPDLAASAATRPGRDDDLEKFEDELVQLGFVMSLDLTATIRRLPNQAIQDLRIWLFDTLAKTVGAHRPHVPLFRAFPAGTPQNTYGLYIRRVLTWLLTQPAQPCPWCGEVKAVGALDPCGHLVCRTCWDGANYAGCPICHRRVALGDPFIRPVEAAGVERVTKHDGDLRLLHLAFDLAGTAKQRFERMLTRATPLSPADRGEIETVIDTLGPKAATWLPNKIAVRETMAIAVARLWLVSPDRFAASRATADHLNTATDVLRVAVVLLGGDPGLAEVGRLKQISRGLRRVVLEALDRLDPEKLVEDVSRHARLWQRVGERLHPFEVAARLPNAALAFAVVRKTRPSSATFGKTLVTQTSQLARARVEDDRIHVTSWAGAIEDALRAGDARGAVEQLAQRPGELLRRADHLVRVTQAKQPEAIGQVLRTIQVSATRGAPGVLLTLGAHIARRGSAWNRRVFFPNGEVLKAFCTADRRAPLRSDAIGAIASAIRTELTTRAESRPRFARAVLDRGLVDLLVPIGERNVAKSKIAWPRGSEAPLPVHEGSQANLRLFLHWEEPVGTRVDLDLSVALYDENWRHIDTCDYTNLYVEHDGAAAAVHSGDLTSAPPPLGASEFVDLDLETLALRGARHVVVVIFSYNAVSFDKLTHGFAGLMVRPSEGVLFSPRAVIQRFDLAGRSVITVPMTIDLETRRMRWLDVHVAGHRALRSVGGYHAGLAHIGKDFADVVTTGARPTLWEVAAIHASARANLVYVRERDGTITQYRRRDGETTVARLARLLSGSADDGELATLPVANAPTWFALMRDDLALPARSEGYVLDPRGGSDGVVRLAASDLVAQLAKP